MKAIEHVFAVNFDGVVHGTLAFMPQLEAVHEAALVNVSSIFGLVGVPGNADYCAASNSLAFPSALVIDAHEELVRCRLLDRHPLDGEDLRSASGSGHDRANPSVRPSRDIA